MSLLGEGGMGAVWRARSLALDIDVAVKVVHRSAASDDAAERLLREARAAASIGHPAIVRVFDFGVTEEDEPYLVMELLEGESLGDWLEREGRIPAGIAVQMLLPVASALAAAHAQGIVHRDIKPENILIARGEDEARHPKLLDFGIVKFATPRGGRVLTEVGMLMGSPEYMSPEQAQGLPEIDGQTDVWSLSIVLYELITGRRPFSGSHSGAVLISIFRDTPVPTTDLAAGDDELWAIIQRGLAKDPDARWEGMRELGRALGAWAVARGIETDASGVAIARQWMGSRLSLSAYPPRPDAARATAAQTRAFEDPEHRATPRPSVRSVPQTGALPSLTASSAAPAGRRTALLGLAAVAVVIAAVAVLGLRKTPSIQASAEVAAATTAPPIVVAPAATEHVSVAPATAAVVVPVATAPSAIASAALPPKRVGGAPPAAPVRSIPTASPSPRPTKPSMPLPAQPNF